MSLVPRSENVTKELIHYREPFDIAGLVAKATENLLSLVESVNVIWEDVSQNVVVDKTAVVEVIDTLQKLESERQWLHNTVEAETITSSVLRHKLDGFPRDIEVEIRDAVRSARNSNIATIQAYKEQLDKTEENINYLKKKLEVILVSNVTLDPEKQELREHHDGMVNILNQTLHNKASMQIKLNETRDNLRETISRTNDFEEAFRELNEDMEAERAKTQAEETRLKKQISDTKTKIEQQRRLNIVKNRDVENSKTKLSVQEAENQSTRETIQGHEERCSLLHQQTMQLSEQMNNECKENADLIETGVQCKDETLKLIEQYGEEKKKLEMEISSLVSEMHIAQNEYDMFQSQKIRAMNLLDASLLSGRKDKDEAEEMQKSLRHVKDDLLHQSSECTRLKRENFELEIVIEKTKQDHIATTEILTKQINDYQSSLNSERKGRQQLQLLRDGVNKESSDYYSKYNKFVGNTTRSINEAKIAHQEQSKRGKELQTLFKQAEETIKQKQEELMKAKERYMALQKNLKGKVNSLQGSIKKLQEELDDRRSKYQECLPGFEELQDTHKRKTDEFEKMKKHIVEVKTKKSQLEATVQSKQDKLEKMDGPKEKVQSEVTEARKLYLNQIQDESDEVRQIENKIYETAQRFEAIKQENTRFKKAIEYFESDIEFMRNKIEVMHDGKRTIDLTIGEYRDWLELQWRKHMELDKKYHADDVLLLDDIKRVEQFTSVREKKIEHIHKQLEQQLEILTEFIGSVADMRTK